MAVASPQRVLGRQNFLYGKLIQQVLRKVYGLRLSLALVVSHDDSAAEFAVFWQFLAFVADVMLCFIVFLRAVERIKNLVTHISNANSACLNRIPE